jgi:hypothetical protein
MASDDEDDENYASPVDYEKEYMDMHQLEQNLGKSASISRPRPRPIQKQQSPQENYDVPNKNNPFTNNTQGSPPANNPFQNSR